MAVIETEHLVKIYGSGENQVQALKDVSLTVDAADFVAIMGASGSGKSTFMNILGALDRPTSGSYRLVGKDVGRMHERELAHCRGKYIGFVFQAFNLLPRTSALDNVELPMVYAKVPAKERRQRAMKALLMVGLGDRLHHVPHQLSGGQQQRVAIARAIANQPALILADEPTGNLDSKTSLEIMDMFKEVNSGGVPVVLVTHEPDIAAHAKRTVVFRDGEIVEDTANSPATVGPRSAAHQEVL